TADHQRGAQPGPRGAGTLLGDRDLGVDVGRTTGRVGIEADEPADAGGGDLAGHRAFLPVPPRKVKSPRSRFAASRSVNTLGRWTSRRSNGSWSPPTSPIRRRRRCRPPW